MSRLAFSAAKSYLVPRLFATTTNIITTSQQFTFTPSAAQNFNGRTQRRREEFIGIVKIGGQDTSWIRHSQKSLSHQRLLCHCSILLRFSFSPFNQGERSIVKLLYCELAWTIAFWLLPCDPCACTPFLLLPNISIVFCKDVYQTSFQVRLHRQHSIW